METTLNLFTDILPQQFQQQQQQQLLPQQLPSIQANKGQITWNHSLYNACPSKVFAGDDKLTKNATPLSSKPQQQRKNQTSTSKTKSTYKHIPHREKPLHLVAKRNARERRRVQAVNMAFMRLRRCVPVENRSKRLSKVKTLHKAIEYIGMLDEILKQTSTSGGDGGEDENRNLNSNFNDDENDDQLNAIIDDTNGYDPISCSNHQQPQTITDDNQQYFHRSILSSTSSSLMISSSNDSNLSITASSYDNKQQHQQQLNSQFINLSNNNCNYNNIINTTTMIHI